MRSAPGDACLGRVAFGADCGENMSPDCYYYYYYYELLLLVVVVVSS